LPASGLAEKAGLVMTPLGAPPAAAAGLGASVGLAAAAGAGAVVAAGAAGAAGLAAVVGLAASAGFGASVGLAASAGLVGAGVGAAAGACGAHAANSAAPDADSIRPSSVRRLTRADPELERVASLASSIQTLLGSDPNVFSPDAAVPQIPRRSDAQLADTPRVPS
jgi:hypothetical protein